MSHPVNPWKDFASYKSSDARYFKGREESIAKFLRIVDAGTMSVLYASSGIGKTSFLQAGIEPVMAERGYAPIHILFTDDDFAEGVDLSMILKSHVEDEIKKHNENEDKTREEKKAHNEDYTTNKWRWNSLLDVKSEDIEQIIQDLDSKSLWWKLHACEIKTENGQSLKPLLLLDQFEEVFVKAKSKNVKLQTFFDEIEELSSNNLPYEVEIVLSQVANQGIFFNLDSQHHYKIIFSLRKEYLSDFDYWTNDRHSIAELQQNRMLLLPLSRNKAMKVIIEQPLNLEGSKCYTTLNNIAEDILNVIDDKQRNEIEPFILSVLCSRLYDRSVGLGKTELKSEDLNTYSANTIIREFYEQKMQSIIPKHSHITRIEEELVDEDGKRGRVKVKRLKDIEFEKRYKKELEDAHLVRIDSYNGEDYIELVHDRVADAINEKRHETSKKKRIFWSRIALLLAFVFIFCFTYWNQFWTTSEYKAKQFPYMEYREGENIWNIFFGSEFKENATHFWGKVNSQKKLTTLVCDTPNVEVSNCPVLKTIKVSSELRDTLNLSISNCKNLEYIEIGDGIIYLTLSIADCPLVQYVNLPPKIDSLKLTVNTPNNINLPLVGNAHYFWQDGILWDKKHEQILYARSDAPEVVNPPFTAKKSNYSIDRNFRVNNDTIRMKCNIHGKDTTLNIPRTGDTLKLVSYDTCSIDYIKEIKDKDLTGIKVIVVNFQSLDIVIEENVFANSPDLEIIDFSACNYVSMYDDAFANCHRLKKIIFPNTAEIRSNAFRGSASIQYVRLPNDASLHSSKIFYCNVDTFEIDTAKSVFKREEDGTITTKHGRAVFADNVRYHTLENNSFYSQNGILYDKEYNSIINIPLDIARTLKKENIKRNGCPCFNNCNNESEYVLFPIRVGYEEGTIIELLSFAIKPTNLQKLHIQCSNFNERNGVDASPLLASIPAEIRQQTTLYVPYNCRWYFDSNQNFKGFKEIKEETWYEWAWSIIIYHYAIGMSSISYYANLWSMNIWAVIVLLLIIVSMAIAYVMYIIDKRKNGKPSKEAIIKIIFKSFATVMLAVPVWYVTYWFFFLTVFPLFHVSNMISDVPSSLFAILVAIMVIYIVLFNDGFSLKGMKSSTKRNLRILWQIVKGNPKKFVKIFALILLPFVLLAVFHQYSNYRSERLMKATTEVEKAIDDAEKRPNIALDILHKAWKDNFSIIEGEPVEDKLFSAIYSEMVSNGMIEGIDTLVQSNSYINDIHVLPNDYLVLSKSNGVYLYKDKMEIQLYDEYVSKIKVNDKGTCLALDKVVIIDLLTQEKDTIDCNTGVYGWHPTQPVLAYYDSHAIRFYDFKARENDKNMFITLDDNVKGICYNKEGNEIAISSTSSISYNDSISFYRLSNGNWNKARENILGKNPSYFTDGYFSAEVGDSLVVWPVDKIGEDNLRKSWKIEYNDYSFFKDGKIALARNYNKVIVLDLTSSGKEYLNLKVSNDGASLSEDGKSIYLSYNWKLVKIPILTHEKIYNLLKSHYNDN